MYLSNLFFPDCLILRTSPFSSTEEFHIQASVIFQFSFVIILSPPPTCGFGFIGVRNDPGEPRDPLPHPKRLESYVLTSCCSNSFQDSRFHPRTRWPREGAKHSLCFCITEIQTRWAIQKRGLLCNKIGSAESTNKLMNLFGTNHPPYPVNVLLM